MKEIILSLFGVMKPMTVKEAITKLKAHNLITDDNSDEDKEILSYLYDSFDEFLLKATDELKPYYEWRDLIFNKAKMLDWKTAQVKVEILLSQVKEEYEELDGEDKGAMLRGIEWLETMSPEATITRYEYAKYIDRLPDYMQENN